MSEDFVKLEITSPSMVNPVEKSYNKSINIRDLKSKLELITGIESDYMKLQLLVDNVCVQSDLNSKADCTIGSLLPQVWESKVTVHAVDTSSNGHSGHDGGDVAKFELPDEAYDQRNESLRKFKKDHNLGRFDAEAEARRKSLLEQKEKQEEEAAQSIKIGDRVEVKVPSAPSRRGVVKYVGRTDFKDGFWVGVHLDEPLGKNDGSVNGRKYFDCPPKYGSFVKPTDVTVGDFPPEDDGLEDME